MAVVLKSQQNAVVDALRAARNADDDLARIHENSWENRQRKLTKLVESSEWKHGPAELLATFDHHLVCKSPRGALVQVEWIRTDGGIELGHAVIHESSTPLPDLGRELMETARSAVDLMLNEDSDGVESMIATIAEALDAGGDLQRRVTNEITLRGLSRNAWWHHVVGSRDGIEESVPAPHSKGDDALDRSVNDLLIFLKEAASDCSSSIRDLAETEVSSDVEALASDIAEDIQRAVSALAQISDKNVDETVKIYEAVGKATPQLLNGISFLRELTDTKTNADSE